LNWSKICRLVLNFKFVDNCFDRSYRVIIIINYCSRSKPYPSYKIFAALYKHNFHVAWTVTLVSIVYSLFTYCYRRTTQRSRSGSFCHNCTPEMVTKIILNWVFCDGYGYAFKWMVVTLSTCSDCIYFLFHNCFWLTYVIPFLLFFTISSRALE
jgi:hypothetical protein